MHARRRAGRADRRDERRDGERGQQQVEDLEGLPGGHVRLVPVEEHADQQDQRSKSHEHGAGFDSSRHRSPGSLTFASTVPTAAAAGVPAYGSTKFRRSATCVTSKMRWTTSEPRIMHSSCEAARGRRVELEHQPQAGRVEEAHAAQVEHDLREAGLAQPLDLGAQLVDRRDVELADRGDAHGVARRLDVDPERLEFPRHRVRFVRVVTAAGHGVQRCSADGPRLVPIVRPGRLVPPGASYGFYCVPELVKARRAGGV